MKKIFLSIVVVTILSNITLYAGGGKKPAKKALHKKESTKRNCPNRPGCICN